MPLHVLPLAFVQAKRKTKKTRSTLIRRHSRLCINIQGVPQNHLYIIYVILLKFNIEQFAVRCVILFQTATAAAA